MNEKVKEGQLRVWHIPQVPMKAFNVLVDSVEDAKKILRVLWDYDIFQYDNNIKPDYSNTSGLETFNDDGTWEEYYDDKGRDIDEIMKDEE
jgi:hypothetical protein